MLTDILNDLSTRYQATLRLNPIGSWVGLGRSILATGTFLTLLTNSSETLFPKAEAVKITSSFLVDYSLFFLLENNLLLAQAIAITILILVIIGYRPRYTGILHWYVSFSFFSACTVIDGGDQVNGVLCFLLIPLTLLDDRKWHWDMREDFNEKQITKVINSIRWSFVWLIRIQVSVIYLHAAVAKLKVFEWQNGTAVYYWFNHHYHGASSVFKPLIMLLTSNSVLVVLMSWGTILLEFMLFTAVVLNPNSLRRRTLLFAGIAFHFAIVIVHGLISFYFTMVGALILYLANHSTDFQLKPLKQNLKWKLS